MKIWIKVEIGAKAQVEERESICANDWEWTRGPNEVARPGSGEGSGGALGLRFPPSHPGTRTAPSLLLVPPTLGRQQGEHTLSRPLGHSGAQYSDDGDNNGDQESTYQSQRLAEGVLGPRVPWKR